MKLKDKLISFNVHYLALPVVKKFVKPELIPFTKGKLKQLPEGSLGNGLFLFLARNNFSYLPHFETHDVKHVLPDYEISGREVPAILNCNARLL